MEPDATDEEVAAIVEDLSILIESYWLFNNVCTVDEKNRNFNDSIEQLKRLERQALKGMRKEKR